MSVEQVLVIPTQHFTNTLNKFKIGFANGFLAHNNCDQILRELLTQSLFMNRPDAEVNPAFKQLIPYCVVRKLRKCFELTNENELLEKNLGYVYFTYQRNKKGGETRLHSLYSLGCGGHLNPIDNISTNSCYHIGMLREVKEELGLEKNEFWGQDVGFIYDESTLVNSVHLGVCHILTIFDSTKALETENTMANCNFLPLKDILSAKETFESWSKIIINAEVL